MKNSNNINNCFKIAAGVSLGAIGWPFFSNNLDKLSLVLQNFLSNNKIPTTITSCFSSQHLTGSILGSQLFVKACGNHSPVMNFIEKGVIGLLYYVPTALVFGMVDHYLGSGTSHYEWLIYKLASVLSATILGAISGTLLDHVLSKPINSICKNVDYVASKIIDSVAYLVHDIPKTFIGKAA